MNKGKLTIGFILDLHGKVNNPVARMDNYMESILQKVEVVLQNNDVIIFCGDIFDSYLTGINFINKLLILLTTYEAQGKVIKIIYGNHDIIGRQYDSYLNTSLGTLCIGRSWLLTEPMCNRVFRIVPLTFDKEGNPTIPKFYEDSCVNILIGHAYYNHPEFNDKWNIDDSILKGFDYCILGHDHQEYPMKVINNCTLCRCGSISRKDINDKDRIPKYIQLSFDKEHNHAVRYVELPHKKPEDCFKKVDAISKDLRTYTQNVQHMIELLQVDTESKSYSLDEALEELKCPNKYKSIIDEVLHG